MPKPTREPAYERRYRNALERVADAIDKMIDAWDGRNVDALAQDIASQSLRIEPWARRTAADMLHGAAMADKRRWQAMSESMGGSMRAMLKKVGNASPTGAAYNRLLDDQVHLIKSMHTDQAERVHEIVREAHLTSIRANDTARIVRELWLKTGTQAGKAKAQLIARTESSRAASSLTQVRAESIGSKGYIWRTIKDTDVRKSHRELDGTYIPWDSPPTTDNLTGHAGCVPNCRCYPEPVLPTRVTTIQPSEIAIPTTGGAGETPSPFFHLGTYAKK